MTSDILAVLLSASGALILLALMGGFTVSAIEYLTGLMT
jgi:hypothetical protein